MSVWYRPPYKIRDGQEIAIERRVRSQKVVDKAPLIGRSRQKTPRKLGMAQMKSKIDRITIILSVPKSAESSPCYQRTGLENKGVAGGDEPPLFGNRP
jgi:hypothetical protein